MNDPRLILADEPTGALDVRSTNDVMALFRKLNDERGITIMLVTHEPDVAAFAKRIVTFRDGHIVSDTAAPQAQPEMVTVMKRSIIARMAILALLRNRSRSLLTMLGVVIGVAAVIVTVAIGTGARTSVSDQINALGSNMIIVLPGSLNQGGVRSGSGGASTLTPADGMAIAKLPHVSAVSPTVTLRTQVVVERQQLADDRHRRRAELHVHPFVAARVGNVLLAIRHR